MNTAAKDLPNVSGDGERIPLRFVTAASLFDGHDAAINIMRRLIQAEGVEVIHLGHNRSVDDIVRAAIQEDADGIAVSSYQGGHNEFFRYMVDRLSELDASHIRVFGGGGGTITPEEIEALMEYGVERIYHPHDGMELGLKEMIHDLVARTSRARRETMAPAKVLPDRTVDIAATMSAIEERFFDDAKLAAMRKQWRVKTGRVPVVGITGTGGSGKSSVTDEILNRFLSCYPDMHIAVLAVDPTRRRTGGALLGDRIRMNSLRSDRVYMRSIATRRQHLATSEMLGDHILFLKSLGFDLVLVETAGIGQSDSEIVDMVDYSVYVMTSDYGAASQLEKIDMLDFADLIVLNKYDKRGAEDALRDIRKQWQRNHVKFDTAADDIPVYPTIASQFNDPGISWMFHQLCRRLAEKTGLDVKKWTPEIDVSQKEPRAMAVIPGKRIRYLAEISEQGREINGGIRSQADTASRIQHLYEALKALEDPKLPGKLDAYSSDALTDKADKSIRVLRQHYQEALQELSYGTWQGSHRQELSRVPESSKDTQDCGTELP
jgi:methylmalonyl-CoA mutase